MRSGPARWAVVIVAGWLVGAVCAVEPIPTHRARQIEQAAPAHARVRPSEPRRVLIWVTPKHLMSKDPHRRYNIPYAAYAMKTLGLKTGAFQPVVSQDVSVFLPENLAQFHAVVLCNASGPWITPSDEAMEKLAQRATDRQSAELLLRRSLVEWLRGGRGLVAFHYAIGANRHWPQFREILGATVAGHPWNEQVGVEVEEPDHPLLAAFDGKSHFRIADEIFQFLEPYSRERVRVLLSLDPSTTNMGVKWIRRTDNDFALAWVKSYGAGRVFYTALGHRTEIFWNPVMLQFYLDAIQFATGDLPAATEPRGTQAPKPGPGPTPPEVRAAKMKDRHVTAPTEQQVKRIERAAPAQAPAKPAKPRRVLVWGHTWTHGPNPFAEKALEILGRKTGAFSTTVSDDPRLLLGDRLPQFDVLVMNNIHQRKPFLPEDFGRLSAEQQAAARKFDAAVKESILQYVRSGKGLVGIHAATAALQDWPEYGEMIGAFYGGHIHEEVVIKVDDPQHPINACFGGQPWRIRDEVYIFRKPYSRSRLHVLLSLDLAHMPDPGKRPDGDYAISWTCRYGDGRVFYTTLGHEAATYWNQMFLQHLLAGVQWAIGDLTDQAPPGM